MQQIRKQFGKLNQCTEQKPAGDAKVYRVQAEKGACIVKIALDKQGKIAGLEITPDTSRKKKEECDGPGYAGVPRSDGPSGASLAGLITDLRKEKELAGLAAKVMRAGGPGSEPGSCWIVSAQTIQCDPGLPPGFGFSAGGFELGLIPDGEPGAVGVQVYWGVADAAAELARLTALGAAVHEPVKDVGGGIKAASVRDPFGNSFSIIENPYFKLGDVR